MVRLPGQSAVALIGAGSMGKVLITGGAGYIGSHVCIELLESGYDIVVADNLCRSSAVSLDRVRRITGNNFPFVQLDIRDKGALDELFTVHGIGSVLHFAGLKAVAESVAEPLLYYDNNVAGTLTLLQVMARHGVKTVVFSSSATVYGAGAISPITENTPCSPFNPYGRTKRMVEEVLEDLAASDPEWRVALLRYFNPVGAHASGVLGEDPCGTPNNLMPCILRAAAKRTDELLVYGNDYPTPDGTGVRDYIHVVDLAKGHVKALERIGTEPGVDVWNLGTGQGYSVLEMIRTFETVADVRIPFRIVQRRAGDVAVCYADPSKAVAELGWKATKGLRDMCEDAWRWHTMNPQGYAEG
jgi:UDP-glucose 4-epimerase